MAAIVPYLLAGIVFGIILVKSEAVSWFRIQEMFCFQSFHMSGILGSAVLTRSSQCASCSTFSYGLCRASRSASRQSKWAWLPILLGGGIFGIGWAVTGTCPGPLFALIGAGASIFIVVAAMALTGTWTYNALPH